MDAADILRLKSAIAKLESLTRLDSVNSIGLRTNGRQSLEKLAAATVQLEKMAIGGFKSRVKSELNSFEYAVERCEQVATREFRLPAPAVEVKPKAVLDKLQSMAVTLKAVLSFAGEGPAFIKDVDLLLLHIGELTRVAEKIGGDVREVSKLVAEAFTIQRQLLPEINLIERPGADLFKICKPLDNVMVRARAMTERQSSFSNHLKAAFQSLFALGWIEWSGFCKPVSTVEHSWEEAEPYCNKVIVEFTNKDERHVIWAKLLEELYVTFLRDYVQRHYPMVLVWSTKRTISVSSIRKSSVASTDPPMFERRGSTWLIKNQIGRKNMVIKDGNSEHSVYIYGCNDSVLKIIGELKNIRIANCMGTLIVLRAVVAICEVVNCNDIRVQCQGLAPEISVKQSSGCGLYMPKDSSQEVAVTLDESSDFNVFKPGAIPGGDWECVKDHNELVWPLSDDLTRAVFRRLDTRSLCCAGSTCHRLKKCMLDPECFRRILLRVCTHELRNDILLRLMTWAENGVQSLEIEILPDPWLSKAVLPPWLKVIKPETINCLSSAFGCDSKNGALLDRLILRNVKNLAVSEIGMILPYTVNLTQLELVDVGSPISGILQIVSKQLPKLELLVLKGLGTAGHDTLTEEIAKSISTNCPSITTLTLKGIPIEGQAIEILRKGLAKLKQMDI